MFHASGKHRSHTSRNVLREAWACDFLVEGRLVDKDNSVMKKKNGHGGLVADAIRRSLLLPNDMVSWQDNSSKCLIENLKPHSVLVSSNI